LSKKKDETRGRKKIVGEIISLSELDGFLKFVSAQLIEAKVEKATAEQVKKMTRGINYSIIIMVIMLFIGGAIAYSIISSQMTNQECLNKLAQVASQYKRVVTQTQQAQPASPQPPPPPAVIVESGKERGTAVR